MDPHLMDADNGLATVHTFARAVQMKQTVAIHKAHYPVVDKLKKSL